MSQNLLATLLLIAPAAVVIAVFAIARVLAARTRSRP